MKSHAFNPIERKVSGICHLDIVPIVNVICHVVDVPPVSGICHVDIVPLVSGICHVDIVPLVSGICHVDIVPLVSGICHVDIVPLVSGICHVDIVPLVSGICHVDIVPLVSGICHVDIVPLVFGIFHVDIVSPVGGICHVDIVPLVSSIYHVDIVPLVNGICHVDIVPLVSGICHVVIVPLVSGICHVDIVPLVSGICHVDIVPLVSGICHVDIVPLVSGICHVVIVPLVSGICHVDIVPLVSGICHVDIAPPVSGICHVDIAPPICMQEHPSTSSAFVLPAQGGQWGVSQTRPQRYLRLQHLADRLEVQAVERSSDTRTIAGDNQTSIAPTGLLGVGRMGPAEVEVLVSPLRHVFGIKQENPPPNPFMMVLVCLIFSVLSTIDQYETFANETLFWMEIFLVCFFGLEYAIRLWSAGCRSKYLGFRGRFRFARKPISIIDLIVVVASICVFTIGSEGQVFATSAIRQVRTMIALSTVIYLHRQVRTMIALGTVIYLHRQELITTLYIGFLGLIFSSYFVYLAERDDKRKDFSSYADALWWGVVSTSCSVCVCLSVCVSVCLCLCGILGSGFALKVQQKQRQKHFNRQIPAAATLIQCLWRCHAAEAHSNSEATWRIHVHDPTNEETVFARMARRASLTLRKRRVSRLDSLASAGGGGGGGHYRESVSSSVSYADERLGYLTPRVSRRESHRPSVSVSGDNCNNDDTDYEAEEPEKVVLLTEAHKTAIRVIRKIKYFVARRKFQQARKPYDVRDVIEQYSQGHLNMMVRIKELQRRLDQTLGKPGNLYSSSARDRDKMTIGARMVRVENQWAAPGLGLGLVGSGQWVAPGLGLVGSGQGNLYSSSARDRDKMTIGARMVRVENQVSGQWVVSELGSVGSGQWVVSE
ncbi:hypothetical protein EGW08_007162 [Elysia chlorotica]|uniref:IKs producing slow voltage-gated potassium channel subunit alpha KvLQT1 n=1 Tax=Elysia chlorotica TaxID=188477 RepID=A0A433TU16_ELYCH|nr:hypothetical protein EGW08_007162 [Elysia chlorotica]